MDENELRERYSRAAFEAAVDAASASLADGGVPIGSALERGGQLLATGHNQRVQHGDPTAHGEIDCLRQAGRIGSYDGTILHTTLAPCAMCSGAIVQFGIREVVAGESRTFPGELDWLRSRGVTVLVLDDDRCAGLMTQFQERFPLVWAEDIGTLHEGPGAK
ncbi:tRNA-specific adenosine deaminase [Flexivirga endophytica]|uniref:tRNA-specific adenosine deaminase n=1 Tax=Flexivirga endophytica TaxID=1849103 RepID=A0A916WQR6_9MICO|nr:nucleoside deaminase [Flexivirga endophytica]GGB25600.1 tRNA-specific adenosine deaminase [Flexivirga endophytica]GHB54195.1 tRNA-specific adenosine deaminase [Flexivirga endophytica]